MPSWNINGTTRNAPRLSPCLLPHLRPNAQIIPRTYSLIVSESQCRVQRIQFQSALKYSTLNWFNKITRQLRECSQYLYHTIRDHKTRAVCKTPGGKATIFELILISHYWLKFNNYSVNRKHNHFQTSPFYSTHKICRSEVPSGVLHWTHFSRHTFNINATHCGSSIPENIQTMKI
jgi:hypothetical protein